MFSNFSSFHKLALRGPLFAAQLTVTPEGHATWQYLSIFFIFIFIDLISHKWYSSNREIMLKLFACKE